MALAATTSGVELRLGEVEPQVVSDLLHAADAVLLPYRRITGSGVLLQALTAGVGVVASDLPYFREVLAPEPDAGVFIRAGDDGCIGNGRMGEQDRLQFGRGNLEAFILD